MFCFSSIFKEADPLFAFPPSDVLFDSALLPGTNSFSFANLDWCLSTANFFSIFVFAEHNEDGGFGTS